MSTTGVKLPKVPQKFNLIYYKYYSNDQGTFEGGVSSDEEVANVRKAIVITMVGTANIDSAVTVSISVANANGDTITSWSFDTAGSGSGCFMEMRYNIIEGDKVTRTYSVSTNNACEYAVYVIGLYED